MTTRLTKAHRLMLRKIAAHERQDIHGLTWAALCARGLTSGDKRWPSLTALGREAMLPRTRRRP